jgi:hypothetical protein
LSLGIAAPLNPTFTKEEFVFYLKDLNASRVILLQGNSSLPAKEAASDLRIPQWEVIFDWNQMDKVSNALLMSLSSSTPVEMDHSLSLINSNNSVFARSFCICSHNFRHCSKF